MYELFLYLINMSISASWTILAVLILRLVLKKAPKWFFVLLWGLVGFRLICPISIESALSLIPSAEVVSPTILIEKPEINTGIPIINNVFNPMLQGSITAVGVEKGINTMKLAIQFFSWVWIVGVMLLILYTIISFWRLHQKVATAVRYKDHIFQSENVDSPFVLGIIKPNIYLPFQLDEYSLNHVIAHEKAHILRKDHWWKPLGFLILTIHWFNPLIWLAYVLLCRDIELACDEKVIKELNHEQRADYTQALVRCSVNPRKIAACPLAFGEVDVKERVRAVMNYKRPAFGMIVMSVVACIGIVVCFWTNPKRQDEHIKNGNYHMIIRKEGVLDVMVSTPYSSGGGRNADNTPYKKGEKVWLEQLDGISDLRGVTVCALDTEGNVVHSFSVPKDATDDEITKLVEEDGWLLVEEYDWLNPPYKLSVNEPSDLIPMVMIDGILYLNTGLESSAVERNAQLDGVITSQVEGNKLPSENDQSNFGTGYSYQYGTRKGTVEICMNGKWWIFATEEARQEMQFPNSK